MLFAFAYRKKVQAYSDQELLSNFVSNKWNKLGEDQRLIVAQEVENRNAQKQGRAPCTVSSTTQTGLYGCYYPSKNEIEVNVSNTIKGQDGKKCENASYNVLDTIYHEGEHSYQQHCIRNDVAPSQGLPQTTKDMCMIENSGNNYDGVIEYDNCTCEIDSNNAATKEVMKSGEIFRNDPKYYDYLKDRETYFSGVENRNMSEVHMQQNEAVYQAYENGDINLKQHDEILLNEVNQPQPVFEEAREVNAKIREEQALVMSQQPSLQKENEPIVEPTIEKKAEVEPTVEESVEVEPDVENSIDGNDETEEYGYKR